MTSSISASERRRFTRGALTSGARRNLGIMAVAALLTLVAYLGLVAFQLGSWSRAEWWLRDIINLRRIFYTEMLRDYPADARKTLVVAGSATLFGVNSESIEKKIGEPTLNLGLHAGLDVDLLLAAANEYVDAGDRVVVPLEFELYSRDKPTALTPSNLMAIFYPYAGSIPLSHWPELLIAAAPVQILEGAWDRIVATVRGKRRHKLLDDPALLADWEAARKSKGGPGYTAYDYSTMTAHGDKDLLLDTPQAMLPALEKLHTPVTGGLSPYGLKQLTAWRDIIADDGATMYLTWPVILEDGDGSIFSPSYWSTLIGLARDSARHGLPIYCDPIDAIVPRQYRFDTVYHLNAKGAAIYSEGLAACIEDIGANPFDFEKADPAELARRAKARIESFRLPTAPLLFPYERNLSRLATLSQAIEDAHARDGAFPATLPPGSDAQGVQYRSDGRDYKLLIEDPDECYVVAMADPDRVDPVHKKDGTCTAYGYWSQGATDW